MSKTNCVAVFGANGYLGRHIVDNLVRDGVVCDAFDVHDDGPDESCCYKKCDVCSEDFWRSFEVDKYRAIIFLAGLSGVEKSFQFAGGFVRVNVGGFLSLLEKVAGIGENAPTIIFPSSRLVYEGGRVSEDSARASRSVYAATKVACEELLSAYHCRYSIPYVCLRICVPYGNLLSHDYSYGTIGFFMRQIRSGVPITIYGEGEYIRTFTHIADICEVVKACVYETIQSGIYNVGGHDYSLRQVAQLIVDRFGGGFESVPWPDHARRVEMGSISLVSEKLDLAIGKHQYRKLEDFIGQV